MGVTLMNAEPSVAIYSAPGRDHDVGDPETETG